MKNNKLKVDVSQMLGFRLITDAAKLTVNHQLGSKIGGKGPGPRGPQIIGSKIGEKPTVTIGAKIGRKA